MTDQGEVPYLHRLVRSGQERMAQLQLTEPERPAPAPRRLSWWRRLLRWLAR